ncbi:MAG: GNAT family N-acetyltransferase [Fimbriimonadaceae bacterium]
MPALTLDEAVEVFVRSFSHVKSRYGEFVALRSSGLWVLQDGPGRRRPQRKAEAVAIDLAPEEAVRAANGSGVGWHFLVDVRPGDSDDVTPEYKRLGYRKVGTETLFVHDLSAVPRFDSVPPVHKIASAADLASVPQRASQPRKYYEGADLYCVHDDTTDHGWVERIRTGAFSYPSSLYVHAGSRGRGFGRALMSRLLEDDAADGVRASVVVASPAGARLYPHLGYEKAAVMQIFCPKTRP